MLSLQHAISVATTIPQVIRQKAPVHMKVQYVIRHMPVASPVEQTGLISDHVGTDVGGNSA